MEDVSGSEDENSNVSRCILIRELFDELQFTKASKEYQ